MDVPIRNVFKQCPNHRSRTVWSAVCLSICNSQEFNLLHKGSSVSLTRFTSNRKPVNYQMKPAALFMPSTRFDQLAEHYFSS
ncbi:CLUMA_CG014599, isoform A [Clunio marinus]|uniref:CLUMA_CG014599, isoform A n=1 Tax=Clunio marinus TaxID=568069 RepID=A0A1J1INS1_9DIPT|nr:CLUMA_CG014599, isoform A [Clunio marinus]